MVKRRESALGNGVKSNSNSLIKKEISLKLEDENDENVRVIEKDEIIDSVTTPLYEKKVWTIEDVCSVTSYKRGSIYNLVSNGSIPYRKCGKKLLFIQSEVLSWINGE